MKLTDEQGNVYESVEHRGTYVPMGQLVVRPVPQPDEIDEFIYGWRLLFHASDSTSIPFRNHPSLHDFKNALRMLLAQRDAAQRKASYALDVVYCYLTECGAHDEACKSRGPSTECCRYAKAFAAVADYRAARAGAKRAT